MEVKEKLPDELQWLDELQRRETGVKVSTSSAL